jgi:hypothetical protein
MASFTSGNIKIDIPSYDPAIGRAVATSSTTDIKEGSITVDF